MLAFAIDLGTPWVALPHGIKIPPDAAHLPERFSLFTLILLGESVVAVMQGMESQQDWTLIAASSAILGMGVSFLICWWYFDVVAAAAEQRVRNRRDAVRFHVWTYAHFPLYLGIVVLGVGIQRIVTAATRYDFPGSERLMLAAGAITVCGAMTTISAATARKAGVDAYQAVRLTA
jgi:low temperature requirement protein LtrA